MNRIITLIIVLTTYVGFSQVVDGINYQAVALDANGREIPGVDINGNVISESMFNVRFTVRSSSLSGDIAYQEIHEDVLTDNFGLFSLTIGHGVTTASSVQATLNDVNWGGDMHFLEVEIDLNQMGDYKTMSNQQMMAVPYAFYALNADKVDWGNIENIPADIADGDDTGVGGTDDQNLTLTGTTLGIEDGNTVDLSTLQDGTGTDDQNLTLTGTTLEIEDGNTVDLSTLQDGTGTDDQNLTLTGTTLEIEDGNTVDLSVLQDGVDDADNDPTNEIDHDWYTQGSTNPPTSINDDIVTNGNVLINGLYGNTGPVGSTLIAPNDFNGLRIKNSDMNSGFKSVSFDLASINTDARIIGGNETSSSGSNGYFAIQTRQSEVLYERFRINSAGNVGINVSDPSLLNTRFQVDGPVRFDNLTASNNTETSALLLNPSNRLVTRTLNAVAFNGEVDGDVTNELQDLDLTANTLSLSNSVITADLSPYLDNTDNQNLTGATLTGNVLQINIQNGTSASVDLSGISDSKWTRNSGFLYPTTISDRIGIGTNAPTQQLQITGGNSAWSLSPTAANVDNLYLHDVSEADGLGAIGGSISFSGPGNGAGGAERRHAAIAGIQTDLAETDFVGLAFFTHNGFNSSDNLQESMRLTHHGKLELNDLSGAGNRMVIADANGRLSTQAIPSGAGNDNLGNHLATMNLDLSQNSLENTHFVSYHNDWAGGADTKTSVHTTRINIPAIGNYDIAWQDDYIVLLQRHAETNATGDQFLFPGIILKDASLVDDWMFVLLGGSGGQGFGSTDLGEYAILNFTTADVTGLTPKWLAPDGLFGSTIGADKQFFIEDEAWVGSRVILFYKKNQTTPTKYSPMYKLTYIASGNIETDDIDIITTVEATYHDVD